MSVVTFYSPPDRLYRLVTQFGGKTRKQAIEGAKEELASVRHMAEEGIEQSLGGIDAVLAEAPGADLSEDQLQRILEHADRLSSLATMFDMRMLCKVAASLGRIGVALLDAPARPRDPMRVHARAARWAADNPDADAQQTEAIASGLHKVCIQFNATEEAMRARAAAQPQIPRAPKA